MTSLKPVCRYIVLFRNKFKPAIFSQNAGFIKQNTNGNQKWTRSRQRIVRNETKPTNAFFETIERYHNYGSSFEQDSVFISHVHLIHYINYLMKIHVELTRTIFTNFSPMLHFYTPWKCQKIRFSDVFREYRNGTLDWNGLTLLAANPQNGQTHSSNSSANYRRIVWVCLTILRDWRLKG